MSDLFLTFLILLTLSSLLFLALSLFGSPYGSFSVSLYPRWFCSIILSSPCLSVSCWIYVPFVFLGWVGYSLGYAEAGRPAGSLIGVAVCTFF